MKRLFLLWLISLLSVTSSVFAANILLWDNDNGSNFYSPDNGYVEGCQTAIQMAFLDNRHNCVTVSSLPTHFHAYDALFVVLGFYCPT